ncbi:MAG TPA: aldo/keto reductase [Candidatus Pullichristensenella stercoripullorum]|nr:aldo/keto reductase [Candidatus Pullichristensenella stercoripullorum]
MDIHSTIRLNNGVEIPVEALGVFKVPQEETAQCVRWALEAGYRHIDTAAVYGNERGVGQGIRDSGVPRQDVFLTTKLWNDDMRKGRVREAFEESLEKLGTDYVDLYLIHWPVAGVFSKCWAEMEALQREGRIRAIGVSNFHQYHMEELLKTAKIVPAVNQIELHPLLTQKPLSQYCRSLGIEIEAYKPLGGTGPHNMAGDEQICAIAQRYGKSGAQLLLRWSLQHGNIILPKSTHKERIVANADIYDFEITAEDMAALDAMNRDFHTGSNPDTFDF